MNQREAAIEAVLFAAGDAVEISRLSAALGQEQSLVELALQRMADAYDFEQRGIMLIHIDSKVQLCSRPLFATEVRRVLESRRPPALSSAALEVLTIVAYRQPVTRAYIEQLRGVDSGGTVSSLMDKGFLQEAGRLDAPGRPVLLCTTEAFLRTFSLTSLAELPALPELMEGEQLRLQETETEVSP